MRVLVVGAGAVGGYFGGRLVEKGEDVTFLVRENRKKQIEKNGLVIKSVNGDVTLQPKTISAGDEVEAFDVILLSTKAYHLQGAIDSIKPYVGENTMIVPLLNGIIQVEKLIETFGEEKVLGGLCFIESTLNGEGDVVQTSPAHTLMFGERSGELTERVQKLASTFDGAKANFRLRQNIMQEMWHKYMFITAMSGVTTLMRAPMGPIREEPTGAELIKRLFNEIAAVMNKMEAPLAENAVEVELGKFYKVGPEMKSSMQRDMEKGLSIEADHLQGYLIAKANEHQIPVPVLETIYANLKIYERQLNK
ncbi:2-dehydropantoate 2-reductase [Bacillus sp. DNRA2]|uniref:2-dehydropantoate 2-reductase n=1 Tax=Bacillus sp. DNRA2 TaxID=2723053 RepID=UPI00145F14A3|nr:2-dehydropantoate 2-reductase [Bacillus sp. DNRA2]NMD69712.1 2-dehydropantoate 2-reductase [Bacillus sp. DNRA2]